MNILRELLWSFLHALARFLPHGRDAVVVLMYHSVSEAGFHAVSPASFRAQMQEIARHGIAVPLADAVAHARGDRKLRRGVAVSFDDGYRDFLTEALPVLRELRIPATVFISGGDVDRGALGSDLPLLSRGDIRSCADPLVSFGSHAMSHRKLTRMPEAEAAREIGDSKESVASLAGVSPRFFAYPKGSSSPVVRTLVEKAGYEAAFAAQGGPIRPGDDLFRLARIQVDRDTSFPIFQAKLTRAASWYFELWRVFRRRASCRNVPL